MINIFTYVNVKLPALKVKPRKVFSFRKANFDLKEGIKRFRQNGNLLSVYDTLKTQQDLRVKVKPRGLRVVPLRRYETPVSPVKHYTYRRIREETVDPYRILSTF